MRSLRTHSLIHSILLFKNFDRLTQTFNDLNHKFCNGRLFSILYIWHPACFSKGMPDTINGQKGEEP
jgi:hypothetical protein